MAKISPQKAVNRKVVMLFSISVKSLVENDYSKIDNELLKDCPALRINMKGNMATKIKLFERILGFIIILTALSKYQLLFSSKNMQGIYSILIVSLFFISAILGFIGLFRSRLWGYIGIYIFAPVATYGMGISVFPFIIKLFPHNYRTTVIIMIGAVILLTAISIHTLKKVASNNNLQGDR